MGELTKEIMDIKQKTKAMIDDLKVVCTNFGLGNASSEYKIITEVFLYKFLCDKFIHEIRKATPAYHGMTDAQVEEALSRLNEEKFELTQISIGASTAWIKREYFISSLFNRQNEPDFHKLFDASLVGIANDNIDVFAVQTGNSAKVRLFDPLSPFVIEIEKRDAFCRAVIDKLAKSSFSAIFVQKYDFFADIFEYLIKDYNKDFGKYAEYYTPHVIASIIAQIMVPKGDRNVSVYDPAAGSGTLVLALAHEIGEDNCTIYTQDISQKSNEFLRLNLILNNLVHSLPNVVQGDTLTAPFHLNDRKDGLKAFDYIVCNPPFNMDFSEARNLLAGDKYQKRFFAGVPSIPNKKIDGMAIYQMFLQHIIMSLKEHGKAAVIVPTGFLTSGAGIPLKIRKHLVDNQMLRGVISMPGNIFATTGTNVSILFIDKDNKAGNVVLMDASRLGTKVKLDGKNQKTVLDDTEIRNIITAFKIAVEEDDFCVAVEYAKIVEKKYSFSAGQYFLVGVEQVALTPEQFTNQLAKYQQSLDDLFLNGSELEIEIINSLKRMKYGK